ncbi:hypothetical protein A2777_00695 [Candidatus Gottesmanbacteria bacterium RIFCSPHIGHO2_01_FULL_40_15]|uniref:Uncharacterized protein n=1 Tax=Candidatus Gottesmanbacteria bacterium RIFCSPHIGHO2_01_FULL_40_15 TaxID=1798376 RepID=A0A1F5Z641_9BACT|nr:MAG: hypothetical protein A2777_00695 [Candidatus Gottesmanbacteria bacterium RIFCSPHIGHO2_01_FULL_40_15]
MYTFIDIKHKKSIELLSSDLVSSYRTMASGATLPMQSAMVNLQEINSLVGLRNQSRNTALGIIITKPSDKSFFVGTAWEDWSDNGQHDEDLALFTEVSNDRFEIERLKPDDIRTRFPLWDGYHHGDKSFLK